jgi:hypothetical protein
MKGGIQRNLTGVLLKDLEIALKHETTEDKHEKIQTTAYDKRVAVYKRINARLRAAGFSTCEKVKIGETLFEVGAKGSCGRRETVNEL